MCTYVAPPNQQHEIMLEENILRANDIGAFFKFVNTIDHTYLQLLLQTVLLLVLLTHSMNILHHVGVHYVTKTINPDLCDV